MTSSDHAELVAARKRIAELEYELAVPRRAAELLDDVVSPKRRYEAIAVIAAEGLPVQLATRVLGVSESGYYEWRGRPLSARLAHRADPGHSPGLPRHLRIPARARRTRPLAWASPSGTAPSRC